MRTMAILGATGSIGTQALDMIRRYPGEFAPTVLTAHSNAEALFALVREFRPQAAGLVKQPAEIPEDLRDIEWFFGDQCSERAIRAVRPDDVLAAVVGIAGLGAVLAALDVSERVLLANKEALVTGGALVMEKARRLKKPLLPVDSEHSAIFQCLEGAKGNPPAQLILTASGGPFRTWDKTMIDRASIAQALGHPTWRMGEKITIDSATLMNKGLEVIEAHYLFDMPAEKISVVVHPESIIHSMVEYRDGSIIAQMSLPDMRAAIGYAMGYPTRLPYGAKTVDFAALGALTFEAPDLARFPSLSYAYDALRAGSYAQIALNGANEVAVDAFLRGEIPFGAMEKIVGEVLSQLTAAPISSVQDVYQTDHQARALAMALKKGISHG